MFPCPTCGKAARWRGCVRKSKERLEQSDAGYSVASAHPIEPIHDHEAADAEDGRASRAGVRDAATEADGGEATRRRAILCEQRRARRRLVASSRSRDSGNSNFTRLSESLCAPARPGGRTRTSVPAEIKVGDSASETRESRLGNVSLNIHFFLRAFPPRRRTSVIALGLDDWEVPSARAATSEGVASLSPRTHWPLPKLHKARDLAARAAQRSQRDIGTRNEMQALSSSSAVFAPSLRRSQRRRASAVSAAVAPRRAIVCAAGAEKVCELHCAPPFAEPVSSSSVACDISAHGRS